MNNLTAREKGFMYVITLLIIVVLGYFFGIRTLNNKYAEYQVELQELQDRKEYLDQLRANNASMATEIDLLQAQCKELELTFIDELETENLEQYVLSTFEKAGCPFLISVASSDVGMASVSYPDGTTAPDTVLCTQITVNYSTTDGYTVTQYNRTPDFTSGAIDPKTKQPIDPGETITQLMDQMGQGEYAKRKGYKEFISALQQINEENKDCIKIDSINVVQDNGVLTLTASINFYGASLSRRYSTDTSTAAYTSWTGHTNVDTKGGFIGFPYVCDNKNSLWYGIVNVDLEPGAPKPFAAYWAAALFEKQLGENNGDYKALLNFEGEPTATPTPAPAQ